MRLHRLEVEGFGPFRDRQIVDFDRFADDGIFLIAGRTGAGKSSILDAVCFGLYGGVPRYDGGEKRLRSDHSEPDDISRVVVEFSTVAGRFRVTRSPEYLRPAKRGGGMTKQAAAVALDEWIGEAWIGRAARAVDVGHELDEILQLSREQFLQVILLAQNRFSEFLLAGSKERQSLLRRLFGTERFEDVQARFDERRRAAEHALGARLATVSARVDEAERLVSTAELWGEARQTASADPASADPLRVDPSNGGSLEEGGLRSGASTDERLDALDRARARADYRVERSAAAREEAEAKVSAADVGLSALRDDRRAQLERDRARAAVDELDAQEPSIAAARKELADARSAEVLRAPIAVAARAAQRLTDATAHEQERWGRWRDSAGTTADVDAEAVRAVIDAGHVTDVESDAGASPTHLSAFRLDEDGDPADQVAALDAWVTERTKELGSWARAQQVEAGFAALQVKGRAIGERVDELLARTAATESERQTLPARIAELTVARDAALRIAAREPDLARAEEVAASRTAAASEAQALAAQEKLEDAAVTDAAEELAVAQLRFAELRRRRSNGMAGELASALVHGEPCPVCGSSQHPLPAAHTDPVSEDDVAIAEAARDAASVRERAAAEELSKTRAALAAASARAEGRTVEQATAEQEKAERDHAESVVAATTATGLEREIDALTARAERLDAETEATEAALASAREEQTLISHQLAAAEDEVATAKGTFASVAERITYLEGRIAAASALAAAIAETARCTVAKTDAEAERDAALVASDFADLTAVELAFRSEAAQAALSARIDEHAARRGTERAILLDLELRTLPEDPIDLAPAELAAAEARRAWSAATDAAARAAGTRDQLDALLGAARDEHRAVATDAAEFETLRGLADVIAGRGENTRKMTLETFVLAAELEEIVEAANRRLDDMSSGRYRLRHSDALAARGAASGLGIDVFDAFTGQTRPARSLSGGETFLSSLALALGLAEVVTARAGGIRLDTLFIDEGFGSLDADTLEVAMRTLDELRQGGRTVGVISHVEAMQEQIPAQLTVRATAEGPSVIEMR